MKKTSIFCLLFVVVAISRLLAVEDSRDGVGQSSYDTCSQNTRNGEIAAEQHRVSYENSSDRSGMTDNDQSGSSGDDEDDLSHSIIKAHQAADHSKHAREEIEGGRMILSASDKMQMEEEAQWDRDYWLNKASQIHSPNPYFTFAVKEAQNEDRFLIDSLVRHDTSRVRSVGSFENSYSYEETLRNEPSSQADEMGSREALASLEKENKPSKTTASLRRKNPSSVAGILKRAGVAASLLPRAAAQGWHDIGNAVMIVEGLNAFKTAAYRWVPERYQTTISAYHDAISAYHDTISARHEDFCSGFADYGYSFPVMTTLLGRALGCRDITLQAQLRRLPKMIEFYQTTDFIPESMRLKFSSLREDSLWQRSMEALNDLERSHDQNIQLIRGKLDKASSASQKAALAQKLDNAQESKKSTMQNVLGRLHSDIDRRAFISARKAQDLVSKLRVNTCITDQAIQDARQAIQDATLISAEAHQILESIQNYFDPPNKDGKVRRNLKNKIDLILQSIVASAERISRVDKIKKEFESLISRSRGFCSSPGFSQSY